jgi:hypothetical protein
LRAVSERRALRRLELALAALGATVVLLAFTVAFDAVRFHAPALQPELLLGALAATVIGRALLSLARQLRAARAFRAALPVVRTAVVHGRPVRVVPGRDLVAFCAGLRRPAVYVSEGTLRAASDEELRAILAHEEHHRARRDPLRLLLARTVADALRPLPPFAALADREAALADLAADAAAVDELGERAPLASALARFDAVAPERVDRLVDAAPAPTISAPLLLAAVLTLWAIAALVMPMLFEGRHPDLAFFEPVAMLLLGVPACLAARRAGICLRPAP